MLSCQSNVFSEIINFIRTLYNKPYGFIPLHAPVFVGNEKKYLIECIDSTFVSSVGKFVDLFEEKIVEYTGAKKAVVCVNGTNALHLALILVGVEKDTEVITQPLTFIATANAINYCGAHPVFLDVDMDTLGLSPVSLEEWLKDNIELRLSTHPEIGLVEQPFNIKTGRRVSAMVPMHTFGHPVRIDEIINIANKFKIPVVEDAAESLGSFYKGQHTGTFGSIGVLSFNGNKIITTGGGGMLLFQDVALAAKAKHLTTQAKLPHAFEFVHDAIGYNYRMPNINAALGLAQLEQIDGFLASKKKLAKQYQKYFELLKIEYVSEPSNSDSNYWLNSILFKNKENRDLFLNFSNEAGVMVRPAWQLLNKMISFSKCQTGDIKNALYISDRLVNIPSSVI